MNAIVIDIETRPDPRIWDDPDRVEAIRAELHAPANWKDPVKIAANIDEQLATRKSKAALDPRVGKLASVAWGDLEDLDSGIWSYADLDDEAEVLAELVSSLVAAYGDQVPIVAGWHVRRFDVPFLTARCARHRIELPRWWPSPRDWHAIADAAELFESFGGGLDSWLEVFDLPRKSADGAESLAMTRDELREYNRQDVHAERELIRLVRHRLPALRERRNIA